MQNNCRKVSWSGLPKEILQSIAQLLNQDADDLRHFKAVCYNWWLSTTTTITALLPEYVYSLHKYPAPSDIFFSSSIFLLRPRQTCSATTTPLMVRVVKKPKGIVLFYHPLYETPLQLNLDPTQFHLSKLAVVCHRLNLPLVNGFDLSIADKIVMFSNISIPCFDDCLYLVLYNGGVLVGSPPLLFGKEIADVVDLSGELNERFDDIVNFNGIICALNSQGKLYQLGIDKFALLPLVDTPIVTNDLSFHRCRKRLVESSATGKLYLVCKSMPCLRVFELSNGNCCSRQWVSRQWVEVKSFGDDDLVLFVSKNYCFFAAAAEFPGCQLRNCIIFYRYAFPPKFRDDWNSKVLKVEEEPKIYQLGSTEGFKPISSYPGFPLNLWSPPQWILRGHTPVSMPSHRGPIESDEMLPSSSNLEGATSQKHTQKSSAPLSGPISRKGTTEIVSISSAQEKTTGNSSNFEAREETMKILSSTEDVDHVIEQASRLEALREECSNTKITHSVSRAYITSITQSDQSDNSTVKFEGLEIRSSLLSTLQKVWSKHGNLTENITICNGDIVSRVLESLATAVLILEENSARSLSDSQADYLSSTLSDLRCMQFKVDWLVPYVESAVELHKSKPLLDSRDKLGHCKAQVAEKISKTLEELAALDKLADELDEEIANVSKVIPFSGNVDLDKLLGGGLS